MKRIYYLTAIAIALSAVFVACKRNDNTNDDDVVTIDPPTPAQFKQVRDEALREITQTGTFDAGVGVSFTSDQGVQFSISANSMYLNGAKVTGDVTLEFVELYDRGNMLVVNKALMGAAVNGDKGPMITGGQFYISLTKDGQPVNAFYNMNVPAVNTGVLDATMTLWTGQENENGDLVWDEVNPKNQQFEGGIRGEVGQYNIFGSYFGWINVDILYSLPDPKTRIWVRVPEGYDKDNCSVYIVYKDKPGALAYMDVWDSDEKMFTEHYGLAPIGFNFFVVFVSVQEDGKKYIYAYQDVVVEEDKIITFEATDLNVIDKDDLISLINNLR